ncbi:MAG: voltage-gated chloride channel family protein [Opitutales bacterium]|nr:voltage-gated chloride channel family protein [Opitutales bacterium]
MIGIFNLRQYWSSIFHLLRWTAIVIPVGILSGSASALFLWSLGIATHTRWDNPWLLYLLPLGGFVIVWVYDKVGRNSEAGNNLILDQIHEPGGGIPRRMAPLVLAGTLLTHLFGGSAGREGTAIQMGGSLASAYGKLFKGGDGTIRMLLMAGIAAGFGSVFGTPLAGAIFAMEVVFVGRVQYDALIPVLVASVVGDFTCSAWGIHHTDYHELIPGNGPVRLDLVLLGLCAVGGLAFGLAGRLFAELTHGLGRLFKTYISYAPLRPVVGGLLVIALVHLLGTRDYLGLGVYSPDGQGVCIVNAFHAGGVDMWSWFWKLLFTAITLGSGFKGGEVTPLFFIGATLGYSLALLLGAPVEMFAAMGFVAVFAGATNTPLACTIMGMELFGADYALYIGVACFLAYIFSGNTGIYLSQRIAVSKTGTVESPEGTSLREARERERR